MKYVMQYMTHPEGGIFSAEDADSFETPHSKHKKEGAYYVWTKNEIEQVCLHLFLFLFLKILQDFGRRCSVVFILLWSGRKRQCGPSWRSPR